MFTYQPTLVFNNNQFLSQENNNIIKTKSSWGDCKCGSADHDDIVVSQGVAAEC